MNSPPRSVLLCTPINPRHVEKSLASAADLVVFDLEDSVETDRKAAARATVVQVLSSPSGPRCHVRVNGLATSQCDLDLEALAPLDRLSGIMVPKIETDDQLPALDRRLAVLERQHGRAPNSIAVLPLIESALGVENMAAILRAAPARVERLTFGAADYTLDIGATLSRNEEALQYIRARIVNASRAHGKAPPIDTVWIDTGDAEGLEGAAQRGQMLGFAGKLCIHPRQVDTVNAVYTPSTDAVAQARRRLVAFNEALGRGLAAIHVDGVLVDYPVAERARRILAAAGAAE